MSNHCVVHLKLIQCISTILSFFKEETIKFNNFIALIFEIYFGFYAEIQKLRGDGIHRNSVKHYMEKYLSRPNKL